MAGKKRMGDKWQYTFKRSGVLDKPLYLTFPSEEEGDAYAAKLDALLDRGIVPTAHQSTGNKIRSINQLTLKYMRDAYPSNKDREVLNTIMKDKGDDPVSLIGVGWVDSWIAELKREHKLKPGTIRAKVGALSRCIDWGVRQELIIMPVNPLRTLPDGYSQYTELDTSLAGKKLVDIERDRRLEEGEYERILEVIEHGILLRKQRPYVISHKTAVKTMFILGLESAMRLREMYTLSVDQVSIPKATVFLEKTKNGDKRQVPLTTIAIAEISKYLQERESGGDLLFPWWDGNQEHGALKMMSNFLSKLYINIFRDAGCKDLTFHCLRHEATSRFFERTTISETKIMKITGHKSHKVMMRYANLRGSSLAKELW